jgi:hypothetical protein
MFLITLLRQPFQAYIPRNDRPDMQPRTQDIWRPLEYYRNSWLEL